MAVKRLDIKSTTVRDRPGNETENIQYPLVGENTTNEENW